jgi:hypothetical protein
MCKKETWDLFPHKVVSTMAALYRYPALDNKVKEIELVLNEPQVNIWRLRELALSEGGFVNGKVFTFLRGK